MAEVIDIRELAELGRGYRVPQLLNERAVKHYRGDPIAQAIAYEDARKYRRRMYVALTFALSESTLIIAVTLSAVTYMPPGALATRWVAIAGLVAVFGWIAGAGGLAAVAAKHKLLSKDAAEGFAAEMTLIRDWYGSWHSIWSWPKSHFGLKKMGEVTSLACGQMCFARSASSRK